MLDKIMLAPIGFFRAQEQERYALGRQSGQVKDNQGTILLNSGCNFEQALSDLQGFDRIWVIYHFHRNASWKPKVTPPRGEKKRGVFATRSPHRPNFIGLSCVELVGVDGLTLLIRNHDLLDGTPILDIKPYLVYADSFPKAKQGWLEEVKPQLPYQINWDPLADDQRIYLETEWGIRIEQNITPRLSNNPFPAKNNRIRNLSENEYEIAYKTWRVVYQIESQLLTIKRIESGYDSQTLSGQKASKWDDLPVHRAFNLRYQL